MIYTFDKIDPLLTVQLVKSDETEPCIKFVLSSYGVSYAYFTEKELHDLAKWILRTTNGGYGLVASLPPDTWLPESLRRKNQ